MIISGLRISERLDVAMIALVISLDYELPHSRRADIRRHMIDPTNALLAVCHNYGAKLTIMLEIAELWAFEDVKNGHFKHYLGYDPSNEIRQQLVEAICLGHDVQMHLHPQWLGGMWSGDGWKLNYDKYRFPLWEYDEMVEVLKRAKKYLEDLLRPHCAEYSCIGFRAGNWNTQPSVNYLRALKVAGFKSDTSVFKWGHVDTPSVYLDYRDAYSNVLPWYAADDINRTSRAGGIIEFPIYTEAVSLFRMLSLKRLLLTGKYLIEDRAIAHAVHAANSMGRRRSRGFLSNLNRLLQKRPHKLDFCKLTKWQMRQMIENIMIQYGSKEGGYPVPIVMIGHSKEPRPSKGLENFLEVISKSYSDSIRYATYTEMINDFSRMFPTCHTMPTNLQG